VQEREEEGEEEEEDERMRVGMRMRMQSKGEENGKTRKLNLVSPPWRRSLLDALPRPQ
jgi:hypothetical protein